MNKPRDRQQTPELGPGRRKLVKALAAGGSGVLLSQEWSKPIVDSVILPLHAQASQRWTPSFGQVFVTAKVESGVMIQATLG